MTRAGFSTPTLLIVAVLAVVVSACGSVDASRVVSPAQTNVESSSMIPPPTEASQAANRVPLCSEIAILGPVEIGNLIGPASPDPVVEGVLVTYAQEHYDTFAGMWIERDYGGTLVLAFTDDPEPHLIEILARRPSAADIAFQEPRPEIINDAPLAEQGFTIDTVRAEFTEAHLQETQTGLSRLFESNVIDVVSVGVDVRRNRIAIGLIDPTEQDLVLLAGLVPVGDVCVEGPLVPPAPEISSDAPLLVIPDLADDPLVSCSQGAFRLSALDSSPFADDLDDPAAVAFRAGLASGEGSGLPATGWRMLDRTGTAALFAAFNEDGAAFVTTESTPGGWAWRGWSFGECNLRVVLPEGLGPVEWRLDPAYPAPGRQDTSVHVLATERACASGQEMGDRLRGPQVLETEDRVLIAFAAVPNKGNQDCPGNPSTSVVVGLEAPLGDRWLGDGLFVPPKPIGGSSG